MGWLKCMLCSKVNINVIKIKLTRLSKHWNRGKRQRSYRQSLFFMATSSQKILSFSDFFFHLTNEVQLTNEVLTLNP